MTREGSVNFIKNHWLKDRYQRQYLIKYVHVAIFRQLTTLIPNKSVNTSHKYKKYTLDWLILRPLQRWEIVIIIIEVKDSFVQLYLY